MGRRTDRPSRRQRHVLRAVDHLTKSMGYPPTFRELGEVLGIASTNGIREHLVALRRKGWVDWQEGKARTIRLLRLVDLDEVG